MTLRRWGYLLVAVWVMALALAPVAVILTTGMLMPLHLLRGRSPWYPRRLAACWIALDADRGCIRVKPALPNAPQWGLRDWFRHPRLMILYLERTPREYGCLVLVRDGMEPSAWRRLYYLLGVSTVGTGSQLRSG
ncbi:hypothetical protein [Aquisalimonas sp.]|uniref:hypothetical protein n=1 Tax=Aquisalimonas sp. TaxID=1872621 RepID=UPI0025BD61B6|nr:hypothetical protein [Aquisalimonas sp.]